MAALLEGSWRSSPPSADIAAADLEELEPLLHRSGAAALAWARLRTSRLAGHPAAARLQQSHRLQTLAAALHRRHVSHVSELFRAHGVEAVLLKGWAAARLYPEEALRPYSDIDFWVPPDQERDARRALDAVTEDCSVDLHVGLRYLDDRPLDAVYERSEEAALGDGRVRLLGPEDHLRLLAVHALGHGVWRPAWLTDIAVALEGRPNGFDWTWFHAGSGRRTEWAGTALRLAHTLLGARLDGVPPPASGAPMPGWATAAILEAWGFEGDRVPQGARLPMRQVRGPVAVVSGLRARWPGPLEATVGVGAAMSSFPRWPVQLAECAARMARFARTIVRRPPAVTSSAR